MDWIRTDLLSSFLKLLHSAHFLTFPLSIFLSLSLSLNPFSVYLSFSLSPLLLLPSRHSRLSLSLPQPKCPRQNSLKVSHKIHQKKRRKLGKMTSKRKLKEALHSMCVPVCECVCVVVFLSFLLFNFIPFSIQFFCRFVACQSKLHFAFQFSCGMRGNKWKARQCEENRKSLCSY